jgi:peroxiredoxin
MSTKRIRKGEKARDFTLKDTQGNSVTLSDFEGKQNVYLVFNRGFS